MKTPRRRDSVDLACEAWAHVRRELVGIKEPVLSRDYLGPMRCTLGERRDLHAGARSANKVEQHFPEIYPPGFPALVNTVFWKMPEALKDVMHAHYVVQAPRSKSLRATMMGISTRVYWERVARAKERVSGAMAIVETVRSLSA